jgi:hypothetical protein
LADANSIYLKTLVSNELFSIVAQTSKTPSRLPINGFLNNDITYFSSFSMYLGSDNEVIINVNINAADTYQFSKKYLTNTFFLNKYFLFKFI